MTNDPRTENPPLSDEGTSFGKAAAKDQERADRIAQQEGDPAEAERGFDEESAEQEIDGAHPPADAGDRS